MELFVLPFFPLGKEFFFFVSLLYIIRYNLSTTYLFLFKLSEFSDELRNFADIEKAAAFAAAPDVSQYWSIERVLVCDGLDDGPGLFDSGLSLLDDDGDGLSHTVKIFRIQAARCGSR